MSYKSDLFKDVLDCFETEELKLFCIDLLEKRSEINYQIPSSTSNKYHNKTQCLPGGQIYHEIMVGTIMNYLLGLDYLKAKFSQPKKRDCLRIAAIMHDCCKTNGGKYTVHEHPILGGEFVENCEVEHDINPKLKAYISRLIKSHSGQWVESKKSKVVLPTPDNDEQFLVHLCDYLGSRSNIDMLYSNELQEKVSYFAIPEPESYIMPFGKYKGKSFSSVLSDDKQYLVWLRDMSDMEIQEPLKSLLDKIGDKI